MWEKQTEETHRVSQVTVSSGRVAPAITMTTAPWHLHVWGLPTLLCSLFVEPESPVINRDWSLFLPRVEHVSAESQRRVRQRHQDPDARLRSQRRQIGGYEILRGGEICSLFILDGLVSSSPALTPSSLCNDLITSLSIKHYRALLLPLGPEQHEIFTCRDCCRCSRLGPFIHS